jgi:hypothetical protein
MSDTRDKYGPLIGSIDEGTSSTRFLVICGRIVNCFVHEISVGICIKDC